MITFIIKGTKAMTSTDVLLKDLPGSGGRMDILCRCISSALLLSHGIRTDVEVILCLCGPPSKPKCIRLLGNSVRHLSPDERSTAILIKKALSAYEDGAEKESTPGVFISNRSFESILSERKERLILLDEKGQYYDDVPIADPCFVIGDHLGFDEEEMDLLKNVGHRMKVSPKTLHASHCIIILHNIMDRANV